MTANLKTTEIIEAVITMLKGGSLGFMPKLVQEGDISYWTERTDLAEDLPALLVMCSKVHLGPATMTAATWSCVYPLRVLLIDRWQIGDAVRDLQQQRAEGVAQAFIGSAGAAYDLGSAIAGLDYLLAMPTKIDLEPAEGEVLKMDESRQIFAVSVEIEVTTESTRV